MIGKSSFFNISFLAAIFFTNITFANATEKKDIIILDRGESYSIVLPDVVNHLIITASVIPSDDCGYYTITRARDFQNLDHVTVYPERKRYYNGILMRCPKEGEKGRMILEVPQ